ncbi:phospholipid/cholesterol/gamma-HCH transport system substrate-binding protein [Allopseudospirillum japonicum]|uniref:Phospholipid/cholesterol/gamma-HCH transport system substrate-binding protein n=1 Tax=Allopseudospirillum japonicum TaxID=64971 RepID=A0A1H6QLU8_9GAMM|nr:outer membrane lipid asymmetry maintenance protein MlaD [Allopseudospirillum japonicum]SEI39952.1 phospholipid/cholesterol/gamma-HCH transport system substrate-binding protein [Allopseudospirillum japonicum]
MALQNKTLELSVGAFMLAGVFALIFLALQVSGLTLNNKSDDYFTLYANFSNIGGLKPRSKVTMAGVTIGRVTAIELDTQWYEAKVTLAVKRELLGKLSQDTSAAILTSGLLGENYIGLTPGAQEETLQDADVLRDTQSALVLEDLVNQFIINATKD